MPYIIREVFCKSKVTIAVYHDPKPKVFRKHIECLSKYYHFISLSQLVNAIQSIDWSSIPPKSLIITFDDGHKGNYKLLDIFKEYHLIPTIFLCSHIINTNRYFWWKTGYPETEKLKKLPNALMLTILRESVNYEPEKEYEDRQALNISELLKMKPYVDFGSHTKFHPILTNCTKDECMEEIMISKIFLEKLLGKIIEHFNFPNGNYSSREIRFVKQCEYKSARTLDCGFNGINSDPYRLKVTEIQDDANINIFFAQISGFFPYMRSLRKKLIKILQELFHLKFLLLCLKKQRL